MTSDEIRRTYLSFFEGRDHLRRPSGSLVPADFDPSVLLTTAGMHPLKPYFAGVERPPHPRLTTCQKCFRTTDIENVGNTERHLTFFEMLGNFSIGDYFKAGAIEAALELSTGGFGFDLDRIWVTVFGGDDALGLGPDEEAIAAWEAAGFPRERIVLLGREDNFWQSGPTGPCGPCSELYLDRGPEHGDEAQPGEEGERFLEFWNLVFMQYDQVRAGELVPLPAQNIDTGLGLNRMALIQQGVQSIFETDQFVPLMALGRELARVEPDERALRILADHARGATFLIADGVVPSNEDRGYILRRLMRRALLQAHRLEMEPGVLPRYVDVVLQTMGGAYPELHEQHGTILKWVQAEEASFGRTLEQGTKLLDELLEAGSVSGEDAFRLHDTFGFPIELTRELAEERGVPFEGEEAFERLMGEQRSRSRAGASAKGAAPAVELVAHVGGPETTFTGYEHLREETTVAGAVDEDGRVVAKLAESPFYAPGGGQVADRGTVAWDGGVATVVDVLRAGDDQALVLEGDVPEAGTPVVAAVDAAARHATQCNHTATHLLHAALRARLGEHVHQAGSYVGPDKLRFDFSHTERLSDEDRQAIEDEVNARILANDPVRPQVMPLDEAKALGAMALFGEKYGDVVRMVEIGDGSFSRELCGGTHVRSTAEIGVFKLVSESSSAANVRRIEALTGPAAVELLRARDAQLAALEGVVRAPADQLAARFADLQAKAKAASKAAPAVDPATLAEGAVQVDGARVLVADAPGAPGKALVELADKTLGKLGDAGVVVLGSAVEGKVAFAARVSNDLVARGVRAGDVVRAAAQVAGGGGGGRDTMAQAGGKDPEKLGEALDAARAAIEAALT